VKPADDDESGHCGSIHDEPPALDAHLTVVLSLAGVHPR